MGKRGVVLIWALLVVVVIAILLSSLFLSAMNEASFVKRYEASVRAFWLAEAGIAQAISSMPSDTSGTVGGTNYSFATTTSALSGVNFYYRIDSTGTVTLPTGGTVSRSLSAVVKTKGVDPTKFQHAIRTTVELDIRGSVDIIGSTEENAALDFPDLFSFTKEEIQSYATYLYTNPDNNVTPVDNITWVNLSEGETFMVTSNTWEGSGILVVAGDATITGGTFDGILYVIGDLRVSGNPNINGTVLVESDAELIEDTTLTGNPTITYDAEAIVGALSVLEFISPEMVSWREQ
jgi:type II secretory pathway pseudopilin PulG